MKVVVAILIAATLLFAGCGGSASKTYTNSDFRFAVAYNSKLSESVEVANNGAATLYGPPLIPIDNWIVDFRGKPAADIQTAFNGPGGVQVVAARAARLIPVPTLEGLRQASKKYFLGDHNAPLKSLHIPGLVAGQWQPYSLDGLHGFIVEYSTKASHMVLRTLYDGRFVYSILTGAGKSAWPDAAPTLNAVVRSFRVTG